MRSGLNSLLTAVLCGTGFLSLLLFSFSAQSIGTVNDQWEYTVRRPEAGWHRPDFNPEGWKTGNGGFGTRDTPGARVGTVWATGNIWLRKTYELESIPENPGLLVHHDEDAEIYLNGTRVLALAGYRSNYKVFPIAPENRRALQTGRNVLAVHCRQSTGGQFIDVHLIDTANVPDLPQPPRNSRPFISDLITEWGSAVTAENAWTEYPRPQLRRNQWRNLNGLWDYAITKDDRETPPESWEGQILVPYSLESRLGGVQKLLDAGEALWYRRGFVHQPAADEPGRLILNFEAVDYHCDVIINGRAVGSHKGGNTPFFFDITNAVQNGQNEILLRVIDETEAFQLRGKQTLNPRGIWYTQVSGIWQTVWMESVPTTWISDLSIHTSAADARISVVAEVEHVPGTARVRVSVIDGNSMIASAEGFPATAAVPVTIPTEHLKPWSPDSPHLYQLKVDVIDANGAVLDSVESYAGIRDVGKVRDDRGHWRFTLNGESVFHWGPLDQGWWPDGLLTPPSDEAMEFEIQWLKKAGFNMIRKHIKVEPRRYYWHCDRIGMMVWQDHVSGGPNPQWTRLQPDPEDANWPDDQHWQFMLELERMIDSLENHPSIVSWVPFNEAWGQHRTTEVGKWIVRRDPSRLINIASGGNFWPVGDIVDAHSYPHPEFPFHQDRNGRFENFIMVMGEFGGHGFPIREHLWDPERRNWGYGDIPDNLGEYQQRYLISLDKLNALRHLGIAGGVYTQTTDVEGEINGLMTYDRKVIKIPAETLAELHKRLFTP